MKKIDNWFNFIIGILVYAYWAFLTISLIMKIVENLFNGYIGIFTSRSTVELALMAILLMVSGDYLSKSSIKKEEV